MLNSKSNRSPLLEPSDCLHIIPGKYNGSNVSLESRPQGRSSSAGSLRRAPPVHNRADSGHTPPPSGSIPTRTISLQAVRRKQDTQVWQGEESGVRSGADESLASDRTSNNSNVCSSRRYRHSSEDVDNIQTAHSEISRKVTGIRLNDTADRCAEAVDREEEIRAGDLRSDEEIRTGDAHGKEELGAGDVIRDSEDSDSSDDEPVRAPNQLLLEFLDCIMKKDYENGKKLCKMILMYEPSNETALTFLSSIEERIELGSVSDESDADDVDGCDDEDDDEDSDESSDESTDESDEESDDEDDDKDDNVAKSKVMMTDT